MALVKMHALCRPQLHLQNQSIVWDCLLSLPTTVYCVQTKWEEASLMETLRHESLNSGTVYVEKELGQAFTAVVSPFEGVPDDDTE